MLTNLREMATADLLYELQYWVEQEQQWLTNYNIESTQAAADVAWLMLSTCTAERAEIEGEYRRRRNLNATPSVVKVQYDRSEIENVRQNTSILKAYVNLTGKRPRGDGKQFKGECPFHQDNTPSFSLDAMRGLYHCFGCGAAGDSIEFVKKMLGVDFKEALGYLKAHC